MCGIIGYLGQGECKTILLKGLEQLQNRGYDSAGISILKEKIYITKYASNEHGNAIQKLKKNVKNDSNNGVAHTRWATHGKKNDINSHPHISYDGKISVVHNGIIENYELLKKFLNGEGIEFKSETDTEVIPHLISYHLQETGDIMLSLKKTFYMLEGTWGLAIQYVNEPNKLYCLRHGSPLLVSCNETFALVASELSGFHNLVSNYFILENNDICEIELRDNKINFTTKNKYELKTAINCKIELTPEPYKHWTLKEIYEQYESSLRTISFGGRLLNDNEVRMGGLDDSMEILKRIDNVIFLGCGTSYYAGLFGTSYFKDLCAFNTIQIFDGAEFEENDIPKMGNTLLIFLSQSGETKDLHRCINIGKENGLYLMGVTNVVDSMIAREVHCGAYLNAGREVGVASTKCFTSQVIALNLISIWFSQTQGVKPFKRKKYIKDLRNLSHQIKITVDDIDQKLKEGRHLKMFEKKSSIFVLGKGQSESIAKEGSLKIKEISYYHAEGYSGSALKHGPFALLEKDFPVIMVSPKDKHYKKMCNAYQEIRSREAKILFITNDRSCNYENKLLIPYNETFGSLLSIIPIQLIAYYLSIKKGINPDYPKNLAKSVVVD